MNSEKLEILGKVDTVTLSSSGAFFKALRNHVKATGRNHLVPDSSKSENIFSP